MEEKNIYVKKRIIYLDYFRGLIILLMIQGHLFRAMLYVELKSGVWFSVHEFIHGVVAPGFLFLSGFLFYYSTRNRSNIEIAKKIKSYAGVVLIGYFLHLPYFSLKKIVAQWGSGSASRLLYMDILQTIGYSLIISALLIIISKRIFIPIIFMLLIFDLAQSFFGLGTDNFFFSFFFNQHISQFPLFPWSIFFFMGIIVSRFIGKFNYPLFFLSLFLILTAPYFTGDFSKLISDSGKLLALFSLIMLIKHIPGNKTKLFLTASKESLFLYVFHMMIIFGSILNKGLTFYIKNGTGFLTTSLIFLIMISVIYPLSFLLNTIKNKRPATFKILKYSSYAIFLAIFLLRKY